MVAPSILVIVPAHDEEPVIRRGLHALLDSPGEIRVVVVANGCSDATADRAREVDDPRLSVVELSQGGKAGAVRHGLRMFGAADVVAVVDADVVVDRQVIPGLLAALGGPDPRIAAPALSLDLEGCTGIVRRYCESWLREPHLQKGDVAGRGVYAVSRSGAERLLTMPDIIADDAWVRARFAPHERIASAGTSTVRPPRTLRAQVLRRARVIAGSRELLVVLPPDQRPGGHPSGGAPPRSWRTRLATEGLLTTAAWAAVEMPARVLAAWRRRRGGDIPWSRDASSRT